MYQEHASSAVSRRSRLDSVSSSAPSELQTTADASQAVAVLNHTTAGVATTSTATATTDDGDRTTPTSTCPGGLTGKRKRRQPQRTEEEEEGAEKYSPEKSMQRKKSCLEAIMQEPPSTENSPGQTAKQGGPTSDSAEAADSPEKNPAVALNFSALSSSSSDGEGDGEGESDKENGASEWRKRRLRTRTAEAESPTSSGSRPTRNSTPMKECEVRRSASSPPSAATAASAIGRNVRFLMSASPINISSIDDGSMDVSEASSVLGCAYLQLFYSCLLHILVKKHLF